MKATSTVDVTASLLNSNVAIKEYIKVYKERNKCNCLIKPQGIIPTHIWIQIKMEVKKMGGKWKKKERIWIVPLERRFP